MVNWCCHRSRIKRLILVIINLDAFLLRQFPPKMWYVFICSSLTLCFDDDRFSFFTFKTKVDVEPTVNKTSGNDVIVGVFSVSALIIVVFLVTFCLKKLKKQHNSNNPLRMRNTFRRVLLSGKYVDFPSWMHFLNAFYCSKLKKYYLVRKYHDHNSPGTQSALPRLRKLPFYLSKSNWSQVSPSIWTVRKSF